MPKPTSTQDKLVVDFRKYYTPSPRQAEAHAAPERYVLFGGAMGGGKSVWMCAEGIQLSLDFPSNRGYLCRHESATFRKSTLLTLLDLLPTEAVTRHNQQDQFIEFANMSRIYYGGLRPTQSDKPLDRIKSMDLGWFGIDEASETTEDYFMLLCSRLRLKGGIRYRGLLSSNPEEGWVKHRFISFPRKDHRFITSLPSDNPFLPDDYVEQLEDTFGGRPDWIKRYLEGNWDAPSSNAEGYELVPYSWLRKACQRLQVEEEEVRRIREAKIAPDVLKPKDGEGKTAEDEEKPHEPVVEFGVDVAGGGIDKSVIVSRTDHSVEILWETFGADTMELVGKVGQLIEEHNPSAVKVDATGIGMGVSDRLREIYDEEMSVAFIGGAKAVEDERFFNTRAEAFWQLRERFEEDRISIPEDPELMGQLSTIRWTRRSDRRILIESKDRMKKRGLKSPDKADALAMAFYSPEASDLEIFAV